MVLKQEDKHLWIEYCAEKQDEEPLAQGRSQLVPNIQPNNLNQLSQEAGLREREAALWRTSLQELWEDEEEQAEDLWKWRW